MKNVRSGYQNFRNASLLTFPYSEVNNTEQKNSKLSS